MFFDALKVQIVFAPHPSSDWLTSVSQFSPEATNKSSTSHLCWQGVLNQTTADIYGSQKFKVCSWINQDWSKSENNRSKPDEGSADIADKWIRPTKGEEENRRTGV